MKNVNWRGVVRALAFSLGTAIVLLSALSVSAAWFHDSGLLISPDTTESKTPAIAATGNVVYVAWSGDLTGQNDGGQIQLRRSFDGGRTFVDVSPIAVSGGTGNATDPATAVNGSNLYIVWAEDDVPGHEGNPEICLAFSNNGGNTFRRGSKKFKSTSAVPEPCSKPVGTPPNVFNENFNLSNTPKADSVCPAIAVNGSNIFVAWSEFTTSGFQIVLTQSANGGNTFAKGKVVNKTLSGGKEADALCPKLAISSSILYGVWMDDSLGNFEIAFRQLTGKCTMKNGKPGECPVINLSKSARDSVDPVIAVHGRNIYVAWADKTGGDFDIFFAASHDGGKTFSEPQNISDDDVDSLKPALAIEGTRVYLAWVDYNGNQGQIKFVRSLDSGVTFGDEEFLSAPRTNARQPALAANGSKVFLAWADDLDEELGDAVSGVSAIFFRFSDASGLVLPIASGSAALESALITPTLTQESGAVRFAVQGANIATLKVEVFQLTGQLVYESGFNEGQALNWNLLGRNGQPLANGVYLYVLTVKDAQGSIVKTKLQKLVVLR